MQQILQETSHNTWHFKKIDFDIGITSVIYVAVYIWNKQHLIEYERYLEMPLCYLTS